MTEVTITQILDDLRAADEITRRFERRYWLSCTDFYALYTQGRLDDGEHTEDFAEWSAYYQVKQSREAALQAISRERVHQLSVHDQDAVIRLDPCEPTVPAPMSA